MTKQRCTAFVLAVLITSLPAATAAAGTSEQDEERRFDAEVRLMFWADASEPGSVADQDEHINDFLVRRARLIVQGRLSESITLFLQVGQDNIGAKVLTEDGSIRIKDAFVNLRAADAIQVAVGQFKIPFLRANLESGFNQILVDRGTLPSLRPAREGSRDIGAMAWGNVDALQYRVALFDGSEQEARNPQSSFRVATRLAYNWFTNETGLAYTGSYLGTTRVLQLAGQLDVQNSRLDPRDESGFASLARDYRAYALEAFFEQPLAGRSALTADGAWFVRSDDYIDLATPTRRVDGHYVQMGFLLPGQIGPGRLQVGGRREDWNTERGDRDVETSRVSGGATYFFKGHGRKLQADYSRKRESPEVENNEFRVSVALIF